MKSYLIVLVTLLIACKKENDTKDPQLLYDYTFDSSTQGWTAGFADFPVGLEVQYGLDFTHSKLPDPLDQSDGALYLSGNNQSDDLFMYLKKEITDLKPNTKYIAKFHMKIASNSPAESFGIGGSPGLGVALGIGITSVEPQEIIDEANYYRMNIDKGNQERAGPDRLVIGNIANGTHAFEYVLITREGEFEFATPSSGKVWATVSTDSGFEGVTSLYYSSIRIEFVERE